MKECPYKNDLKQDWNGGRCRHTGYYCTLEQEYRCDVKRNATKTTNADKIRSMSDEELARFFEGLMDDESWHEYEENLEWLKSKVEE